nr:hypothetical protein CFP56_70459 [Quercus suber]
MRDHDNQKDQSLPAAFLATLWEIMRCGLQLQRTSVVCKEIWRTTPNFFLAGLPKIIDNCHINWTLIKDRWSQIKTTSHGLLNGDIIVISFVCTAIESWRQCWAAHLKRVLSPPCTQGYSWFSGRVYGFTVEPINGRHAYIQFPESFL